MHNTDPANGKPASGKLTGSGSSAAGAEAAINTLSLPQAAEYCNTSGEHSSRPPIEAVVVAPYLARSHGNGNGDNTPADHDAPPPEEERETVTELNDLGNALRLVLQHGRDLRYCHTWKKWLRWDGARWAVDETREVERRAKRVVRSIYREASAINISEEQAKAIAQHAGRSHSERAIKAMVHLAESELPISRTAEQFDAAIWALNCTNGTIDLQTGNLREHRRDDLNTKLVPVPYNPDAACPRWRRFLSEVFAGNGNLIGFIQRAVGYSLTGSTREHALFFLYGAGANGKSTLLNTLTMLLGDYAWQANPDLLMARRDGETPSGMAHLAGRRLVVANEVEEGRRFSAVTVKILTSEDTINARRLYENEFTFQPTHKVFLAGNHKPVIKDTDNAIWRRPKLIPFNVVFTEEQQDKSLSQQLAAELPGILAWAVQGCVEWYCNGLQTPEEVAAATDEYRLEMDVVGRFIDECCSRAADWAESASALYQAYKTWCEQNGENQLSGSKFGTSLEDRGHTVKKVSGLKYRQGLRLLSDREE